jgi:hypothetical protein
MKRHQPNFRVELCAFLFVIGAAVLPHLPAEDVHLVATARVASGWHPWYELKIDPEDPENLLLCGTKWDAHTNAPFGFVYGSSDQGKSWASALEDRSSAWVTEQSCAFGTEHRAYFISEASRVIDGTAHHELGTTRLYVSRDAGRTWKETLRTGWADWSTSAVSLTSGRPFTFFNAYTAADSSKKRGSNVGLLTFSPDGSAVSGPFFVPSIVKGNYQGAYPSGAVALRTGTVMALWYGMRLGASGVQADLNVIRVADALPPVLTSVSISALKSCAMFNQASLAYDPHRDHLFVLYLAGCKAKQILLASSDDEGRTWSKSAVVAEARGPFAGFSHPSLVAEKDRLAVLWEAGDGSSNWFLSTIESGTLVSSMQLSSTKDVVNVGSESLLTSIENSPSFSQQSSPNSIRLNVRNDAGAVWRANGLLRVDEGILVVWPSNAGTGADLWFGAVSSATSVQKAGAPAVPPMRDVTEDSIILYGGTQDFDDRTSMLTVCLTLKNAGLRSLTTPIELRAENIASAAGPVTASNATNGVTGAGAIWDISNSITGDRIPPHATSNPFCLTFRLKPDASAHHPAEPKSLLSLILRVFSSDDNFAAKETAKGARRSDQ